MPEKEEASQEAPQPRPFWSGTIAFGLVTLPVSLYLATRRNRVSLRMVDEAGTPLGRRYFCPREERALSREDVVRGYEVGDDEFVLVEDEELERLAPEKSQEIDLRRFVALSEIDPMIFERAYFLAPDKGAVKAYRLLARSMEDAQRAGIATFVMRGKEYLVAIIAQNGLLRAETLRFHDELRSPVDVGLPQAQDADAARVRGMREAMKPLTSEKLDRSELSDRYSRRVLDRVREKLQAGEDVVRISADESEPEEGAEVVDLMAILKQSLEQGSAEGGAARPRRDGSRRRKPDPGAKQSATRAELYERAKALDIPGRSNMTRDELIDALRDAG